MLHETKVRAMDLLGQVKEHMLHYFVWAGMDLSSHKSVHKLRTECPPKGLRMN